MFGGQIPQLESLTLSGFTRCPSGFLKSLKHLALRLPPGHPTVLTTKVVDLLTAAPNIEALSLTSFLSVVDDSSPSHKATLPRLRNALLRGCDTVSILPRIAIPEGAQVHVSVDHRTLRSGTSQRSADLHILLALPPSLGTHLFLPVYPKLTIEIGETLSRFTITLTGVGSAKLCLKISVCSGQIPLEFVRRSLEAIPCHAYLRTARHIAMSIPPTVPGIGWSSWLKKFAFAVELSVRALPAEVVLGALMRTDGDGLPVCPCLRHVEFYGSEFSARTLDPKWIAKLLLFRVATGFSLEKITVMERGVVQDYGQPAWLDGLLGN